MPQLPIQTWLTDTKRLQNLISRAHYLNELNLIVRTYLGELATCCEVANYTGGKLKLVVTSSAWASRLRFCIPQLLKNLKNTETFNQLQGIEFSIHSPARSPEKTFKKNLSLSQTNAELITMTAQSVTDSNLQHALLRLAQKANKAS